MSVKFQFIAVVDINMFTEILPYLNKKPPRELCKDRARTSLAPYNQRYVRMMYVSVGYVCTGGMTRERE